MPTTVRSHAKVNLGLAIGAPRVDGFHALVTVYQTLEAHDLVRVNARIAEATAIRITSNDWRVPTDGRNTAWKIVSLILDQLETRAEVDIHIEKRLPVQGGLGAGSGNAVAALVGLERELGIETTPPMRGGAAHEWGTRDVNLGSRIPWSQNRDQGHPGFVVNERANWRAERLELAARVGSDVPLFLIGGTVLGVDRGQEVVPLPDLESVWCVVATPAVGVSTPQAFRDWDALCAADGLTAAASTDKLNELSRAYASAFAGGIPTGGRMAGSSGVPALETESGRGDLARPQESALVRTGITSWIENDFERVVFRQHPSLAEIKHILEAAGTPEAALHASLSGSGSALFGLYQARADAEAALERLRAAGIAGILTRTLPRAEYWSEMLLESGD
jgi:4-diphosphocytidyl-2-C-methyl-D-erythritol kinase